VLELMAEGMTNAEIGDQLGVTERTVKAYAQELYDKLGVRNRAGAVAEAAKLGLL
jgi:DNA-binding NarL/FixJ family response regulator